MFFQLQDSGIAGLEAQPINEKVLLIVILFSMLIMMIGTLKKPAPIEEEIEFTITNNEASIEADTETQNNTDVPTTEE